MALIRVNTGLSTVRDLNAFEQIFHKLFRDSVLIVNEEYMKYIKIVYSIESDGFDISLKKILNASFNVFSELLNATPITTTLFGLTYSISTKFHTLKILDTVLLFKFEQFKLFLDHGGMFVYDSNFANALDFLAIKIHNIIKSENLHMPILTLPEDENISSYILNNFSKLLDCTVTYLVNIKRYTLYDVLHHVHIYSRLVFYNIAIILDKFIKLAKINGELNKILELIIDDYSQQIGDYLSKNIKIDELINFTRFLIPYLFFNIKSIHLIFSYIKKQENRILLYKIPLTLKLFFQCIQDGILKNLLTEDEYIKDIQLFAQLGIDDDNHFLRKVILCHIRTPELKMIVMDTLNAITFPEKQFKSTNLLPIIIESVKSIENMHILEYVLKRFESSKEFLFQIILENMAKIMFDHLNNTEFFIKIISIFIDYGFELSIFPYFLDQCFEQSATINTFYKIMNNNTIINSIKYIHFDTFKYCHKNIYSKIAKKWNISNKIMINGVSALLKNIFNKIIEIHNISMNLPILEEKPLYTEDEIISIFETSSTTSTNATSKNAKKKKKKQNAKNTEISEIEIPKIEIPEIEIPKIDKNTETIKSVDIENFTEIIYSQMCNEICDEVCGEVFGTIDTTVDTTVDKPKKYSENKLIALQAKKISKALSKLTDAISIKAQLNKLVISSLFDINKKDTKFIIYTGGSVGLGTNISSNGANISSDLDLCLILNYIEDNLNAFLNVLLSKLKPFFQKGYKLIPSGKKSPTMITMVTKNSQAIPIDLSICVCNRETPFDFTDEHSMIYSIYQAYTTCSSPEYRFLFYDTNATSLSSLHASYALIFNCTIQSKISKDDISLFQGIVIGIKMILIQNGAYGSTIGYLGGSAIAVMAMIIILRYNILIHSIDASIRLQFGIKKFTEFYSNEKFWKTFGLSIIGGIIDKPENQQNVVMYIDAYGSCLSYNVWEYTMDRTISIFKHISMTTCNTNIAINGYYYTFIGTFCSKNLSNTLKEIIITLQCTNKCNIIPMSHPNGFVLVIEHDLNIDYVKAVVRGCNLNFKTATKHLLPIAVK